MNAIKRRIADPPSFSFLRASAAIILGWSLATAAMAETPPVVGTATNSAHTFLTFQSYPGVKESPNTAQAYYHEIDPGGTKVDFRDWLVNAGFIGNRSQWRSTGQQTYTSAPGVYGNNIVNAFAHIIILNAADLGFIRNQYIRCKPDCKTPNAKIYTYLENYPVPAGTVGLLATQQAVNKALERRVGRIADVAFEWAPAAYGTSPVPVFGQLYSFIVHAYDGGFAGPCQRGLKFNADGSIRIDELYTWPDDQPFLNCALNNRSLTTVGPNFLQPRPDFPVVTGQDFAPELDQLGTKQHPGVCFVCHGGKVPTTVQNTGIWPNKGYVSEFRMLPADIGNAVFGVDDRSSPLVAGMTGSDLTVAAQQIELKKYNQVIAITQGATPPKNAVFAANGTITGGNWTVPTASDGAGTPKRASHGLEVIFGWYAGFVGDLAMTSSIQNDDFVPVGWQTNAESRNLYKKVMAPSCRSCHMNREQSLDLGTLAQFDSKKGGVEGLVFQPECDSLLNEVKGTNVVMPLAKLTWDRFWNGIDPATNLSFDAAHTLAANDPNSQPFLLKQHFGYGANGPTSYCGKKH
jgi:mono/diheme cytochrome c family protein